jgi:ABC-type transport system involved in cytochrome bd biosynthesis fused ATPase/permease subunit
MKTYNSSEILRNTDTEVQNYVTNFFNILKFSKDFFLLFSIFLLLLAVDVYSTIIALFFLLTCVFLYLLIFYNYLNKLGLRRLTTVNSIYQWINQTCGAIKEIKISRKENLVLKKFSEKVDIFEQSKKITEIISALPIALFELAFVVIVLLLIKFLANTNTINSLPILSLYIVAFIRLLPIVSRFGSSMSSLRSFNPSVQLLNYEINKLEKYSKLNGKLHSSGNDLVEFNINCELRDLSFKYNDGNQYIFNQFNLSIDKGKSIAFLGKSGSGKTTLLNLLCGLLKQSAGEILVDGKSINNNISEWQKNIGLISQDNYLLDDTLRNNIIFFK